jgi:hypothetical protein
MPRLKASILDTVPLIGERQSGPVDAAGTLGSREVVIASRERFEPCQHAGPTAIQDRAYE